MVMPAVMAVARMSLRLPAHSLNKGAIARGGRLGQVLLTLRGKPTVRHTDVIHGIPRVEQFPESESLNPTVDVEHSTVTQVVFRDDSSLSIIVTTPLEPELVLKTL